MYLKIFLGINIVSCVALALYEKRVASVRSHFLETVSLERFIEMVDTSMAGIVGLLSFTSVVLSIWAGFGFAAPTNMKSLYGEDIFMIIATCALALLFYAATLYAYHLSQFLKFKGEEPPKEFNFRKEIFIRGETFFIFGTAFFLLTCLYSVIMMSSVLSPSSDCLVAIILFFAVVVLTLTYTTASKLWQIIKKLRAIH
jgi:hypothetical protein